MPFVTVPGLPGKLYVPKKQENRKKKHPCKDCFSCEHCSEDRCNVCRGNAADGSLPSNDNYCPHNISPCICRQTDSHGLDEH